MVERNLFRYSNKLFYYTDTNSNVHQIHFPNRDMTVQLVYTVPSCKFPHVGLYLVEPFCNNQWIADTTLLLR